jgi:hypothetical protein
MSSQNNLGAFGHGLWRPARLSELEQGLDLRGGQLKGRQCELMGYVAPPNVVGNRRHYARLSL